MTARPGRGTLRTALRRLPERASRNQTLILAGLVLAVMLLIAIPGGSTGDENGQPVSTATPATGTVDRTAAIIPATPSPNDTGTPGSTSAVFPLVEGEPVDVVLIIDDLGNSLEAGRRTLALPGAVTLAVLPYTPHARTLAEQAHAENKELMLHAPMSNLAQMPLGEGALTPALDETAFHAVLDAALAAVPHVRGVNNHTGSELTARTEPMQWLMDNLRERRLYFVDSMTTGDSVAGDIAAASGVPTMKRHVFLDNEPEPAAIDREFRRLLEIARRDGRAVGIGHPYPQTLDYLEVALPLLPALGYRLRYVSELLEEDQSLTVIPLSAM